MPMTVDERVLIRLAGALLAVLVLVRWLRPSGASSSAADLILRAPEPVRIVLPGVSSPSRSSYSRWRCGKPAPF